MMYISRAIIAGYAFWLGYQVHKHDLVNRAIVATRQTMEELAFHNGRAFADGVASTGKLKLASSQVNDATG